MFFIISKAASIIPFGNQAKSPKNARPPVVTPPSKSLSDGLKVGQTESESAPTVETLYPDVSVDSVTSENIQIPDGKPYDCPTSEKLRPEPDNSRSLENATGEFSSPGKAVLMGNLKTIATKTFGGENRQKSTQSSTIGYKSEIVLTSIMKNEVEEMLMSKVVTLSRTHFRLVPKSHLMDHSVFRIDQRAPFATGSSYDSAIASDLTSNSIFQPFQKAVEDICWNLEELLRHPHVNFAILVQGVVSDILAKKVILRPLDGYIDDDDIKRLTELNVEKKGKHARNNRIYALQLTKGNQTKLDGRLNYLQEVASEIDAIIAPVAKLNKDHDESCDILRRDMLFEVARSADDLSYLWGSGNFNVSPIDKICIEQDEDILRDAKGSMLYQTSDDPLESAIQYHESRRLHESETVSQAWPIIAVVSVGFVKYEAEAIYTCDDDDTYPAEIWAKAGLLLGEQAITIESNETMDLGGVDIEPAPKMVINNQMECSS